MPKINTSESSTCVPPSPVGSRFQQPVEAGLSQRRAALLFAAVAIVALALRLCPLLKSGTSWAIDNDSRGYIELAQGLAAGCGFARLVGGSCRAPEVSRTPGYPAFLAIMPGVRWAVAVQAVIGALTCVAIGLFATKLWGLPTGIAAASLIALDIPSIVVGAMIMSDCLFAALVTFGLLLGFLAIARQSIDGRTICFTLLGALVLGMAILVRPIGLLLPLAALLPFLVLPHVNWQKRVGLSLAALAIPVMVMAAWSERNRQASGIFTMSAIGVYNLYFYRAPGLLAFESGKSMEYEQGVLLRRLHLASPADVRFITPALYHEMLHRSLAIILNRPLDFAAVTLRSLVWQALAPDRAHLLPYVETASAPDSYSASVDQRLQRTLRSPLMSILIFAQFVFLLFIWSGVARALWRLKTFHRRDVTIVLIAVGVALTLLALAAGPEAQARFRIPAIPMIALVAAFGWFAPGPSRQLHPSTTIT